MTEKRLDRNALRKRGAKVRGLISGLDGLASRKAHAGREEHLPLPGGSLRSLWYGGGSGGLSPLIIDMHSGGFIMMSADSDEEILTGICRRIPAAAVSLDYPLAPEHPWPEALGAVCSAVRYLLASGEEHGIDPSRLAVYGHSAGANLAAAAMIQLGREGLRPFRCAVLEYPVLDMATDPYDKPRGVRSSSRPETLDMYTACYLPDGADPADPLISPLFAAPYELACFPPVLMTVCGNDPLRPEGIAFADRLAAAGTEVSVYDFKDCGHGFTYYPGAGTSFALDTACAFISSRI